MQQLFNDLADHAIAALRGAEVLLVNFSGESTDFVRFNQARVRQPMTVRQAALTLSLIDGARRDNVTLTLTGDAAADRAEASAAIERMRGELGTLAEDPYLLYARDAARSTRETAGALPAPDEAIDAVIAAADGADLVGILASGPLYRGFASSLGARHWHAVDAFLLDWSLYHSTDKAVKSAWAGTHWNRAELMLRMAGAREQLAHLARPPRTIAPGEVRAWLSPAAVDELIAMLSWGGVSHKAQRTKQSCIQQLADGEAALSPLVTLREDAGGGMAPMFDDSGFTRPASITLVDAGRHAGSLISARTAQEFGIAANGADDEEALSSVAMTPGTLAQDDVLAALDTGVYVGNLHYLNFSDRAAGRITGLTRFATFWVEGGRIVAPLSVMRFDDTLYRVLGSSLEALGANTEWMLDSGTYGQRSVRTSRVSGALLSRFELTL